MSHRVEEAIARVQGQSVAWDGVRAARVLSSITRRNEARLRRKRFAQRAFVLTGACTLLVVASLRAASAPSMPRSEPAAVHASGGTNGMPSSTAKPSLAQLEALDDGGAAALDGS